MTFLLTPINTFAVVKWGENYPAACGNCTSVSRWRCKYWPDTLLGLSVRHIALQHRAFSFPIFCLLASISWFQYFKCGHLSEGVWSLPPKPNWRITVQHVSTFTVKSCVFLFQRHSNASQSLCEIIRLSRDQMLQVQNSSEPDPLLASLEK